MTPGGGDTQAWASRTGPAPLPVATRCYEGEDLTSWATRHTARNHTTIRAVEKALRHRDLLHSYALRDPERLERWRRLGNLHPSTFTAPTHIDGIWVTSRDLCLHCTQGNAATGRLPHHGWVCLRHGRWTDPPQHAITSTPGAALDDPDIDTGQKDQDGRWNTSDSERPRLHAIVFAAERAFRRDLAPRGVLVDSPLMLFALDLAHLARVAHSGSGPDSGSGRGLGSEVRRGVTYAGQVRWARSLADPAVRVGLTHPSLEARGATIDSVLRTNLDAVAAAASHIQEPWCISGSTTGGSVPLDSFVADPSALESSDDSEEWRIRHRLWRFSDRLISDLRSTPPRDEVLSETLTCSSLAVPLGSAGVA